MNEFSDTLGAEAEQCSGLRSVQSKGEKQGGWLLLFCVCSTAEQTKGLAHASLVRRVCVCCALIYVCTYVKVKGHPDNNLKLLVG